MQLVVKEQACAPPPSSQLGLKQEASTVYSTTGALGNDKGLFAHKRARLGIRRVTGG